jgi:hypothetical protein
MSQNSEQYLTQTLTLISGINHASSCSNASRVGTRVIPFLREKKSLFLHLDAILRS